MEDYLTLWGITPNLRHKRFQELIPDNPSGKFERLIETYPNWGSSGRIVLSQNSDIMSVMGNFCSQLYEKQSISQYFMFKNISEFFTEDVLKIQDSDLTVIFEVGGYKLYPNEQRAFIDILYTLKKLNRNYILCARVDTSTLGENLGMGVSSIITSNCKAIKI